MATGALQKNLDRFEEKLEETAVRYSGLFEPGTTGLGMMRGLKAKSSDIQKKVIATAFEEGVLVLKAGQNRVRFLPPLTITEREMEEGFARLHQALDRC